MKKIGILIHPEELDDAWVDLILANAIDVVGFHPAGGTREMTFASMTKALEIAKTADFQKCLARLQAHGVETEYAFHGMSYLMPTELLRQNSDFCRMDPQGERTPDANFCPSSKQALEALSSACFRLAKQLTPSNHRYHIWQDDAATGECNCPACRSLSRADQALLINHAILEGVRAYDSQAMQSYLAYCDTLSLPKAVIPNAGIYLEFAPYQRDFFAPLTESENEKNQKSIAPLPKLVEFFGKDHATVLDYWLDNSLYSGYRKPPKALTLQEDCVSKDCAFYAAQGFAYFTTFACFLGEDYRNLYGDPPLCRFATLANRSKELQSP